MLKNAGYAERFMARLGNFIGAAYIIFERGDHTRNSGFRGGDIEN
jgi:hypothetical protein